jgi:hypothetical protein
MTKGSYFGPTPSDFTYVKFQCSGDEANLDECYDWNHTYCPSGTAAGVVCEFETSSNLFHMSLLV